MPLSIYEPQVAVVPNPMRDYSTNLLVAKQIQWGSRALMAVFVPADFYNTCNDHALKTMSSTNDQASLWAHFNNNLNTMNVGLAATCSIDVGFRQYIDKLEAHQNNRNILMNITKIEESNEAIRKMAKDIKG